MLIRSDSRYDSREGKAAWESPVFDGVFNCVGFNKQEAERIDKLSSHFLPSLFLSPFSSLLSFFSSFSFPLSFSLFLYFSLSLTHTALNIHICRCNDDELELGWKRIDYGCVPLADEALISFGRDCRAGYVNRSLLARISLCPG